MEVSEKSQAVSPASKSVWERRAFEVKLLGIIPDLRAFARFLCGNPTEADDLVQDALMRAWSSREQFAEGTNFKAWIFTILRNRFLDLRRRDRETMEDVETVVDERLSVRPTQETAIHFDDVARALWRLNPHHRKILMLVGANGLSYEEAAKIIGCAVGTVRSRLSRARDELKIEAEQAESRTHMRDRTAQKGAAELLSLLHAA